MAKIIIIGAGGVGRVVTHKCAQLSSVFSEIILASRTLKKCDDIAIMVKAKYEKVKISTTQVDADDENQLINLFEKNRPFLVINVALPYQDLTIMEACLKTNVHYLDTANYEPLEEAKYGYHWQWAFKERFKKAGLMAVLGCGFDPGVTSIFTAYAAKHHFDELHYLDIVDCNGGDHGNSFATNFNSEINIREVMQKGKFYEKGSWKETAPHEISRIINYPNIGPKKSYLINHEELESLVKNFPTLRRARFWMTFGDEYLTYLRVIQNIGMAGIEPINFQGNQIIPLQFLSIVLPDPVSLAENYEGETSIGCRISGLKNGCPRTYYIYNNCDHRAAYLETGAHGISYTTGVPAALGAKMMITGKWSGTGVFNVETFDPDPFLEDLSKNGLIWHEIMDQNLEMD